MLSRDHENADDMGEQVGKILGEDYKMNSAFNEFERSKDH